jgi:hypothetical protein
MGWSEFGESLNHCLPAQITEEGYGLVRVWEELHCLPPQITEEGCGLVTVWGELHYLPPQITEEDYGLVRVWGLPPQITEEGYGFGRELESLFACTDHRRRLWVWGRA